MADYENTRKAFEDTVFNRRFRASIQRNPNPPKGFGGLDFISTDCPTQAELCKRDPDGDYEDEAVSAMWWGWCSALTHGVAGTRMADLDVEVLRAYSDRMASKYEGSQAYAYCPSSEPYRRLMKEAREAKRGLDACFDASGVKGNGNG